AIASGMGTCGLVGPIGVYTGWMSEISAGTRAMIAGADWIGLISISVVLPAILTIIIGVMMRKVGWIKTGDLKLD
ncbi:MAG: PTS sugar transporter subunit IIC, partial [Bacteroidaceae bacterium]|nr:PTS sugar transporter subunit IIC [Bacteroidaceae bacterium]